MKLTNSQILSCAGGYACAEEEENGILRLNRFTREQREAYRRRDGMFFLKSCSTAGVTLRFETDSPTLELSFQVGTTWAVARCFFVHSIYVNGKLLGRIEGQVQPGEEAPAEGAFLLGEGSKLVEIYFPWSACSRIREVILADGASFAPAKRQNRMLIFGDSITQGYDAMAPENAYAVQLAKHLDADAVNKAIGGEVFWPELAKMREDFQPDIISVAYGTNDWGKCDWQTLEKNSRAFYHNLRLTYPNARILTLAPIWRADFQREKKACPFEQVAAHLKTLAEEVGAEFVDCFSFVPQESEMFSDKYLHPNDGGFDHYSKGLRKAIRHTLSCVTPDIYRLTLPFSTIYTSVFVLKTPEGAVLFDTATYPEDVDTYIVPALEKLGLGAEELKMVVVSHNHGDHAGGLTRFAELYPDTVIAAGSTLCQERVPGRQVRGLAAGELLMGCLQVVAIPGHTADAVGILDTRTGTLLSGDGLQLFGIYGPGKWGANIGLPAEHLVAVESLRKMDIHRIVASHNYRMIGHRAEGEAVSIYLDQCREGLMAVLAYVKAHPEMDDETVIASYNAASGLPTVPVRVVTGLRKAMAEGKL